MRRSAAPARDHALELACPDVDISADVTGASAISTTAASSSSVCALNADADQHAQDRDTNLQHDLLLTQRLHDASRSVGTRSA